MSDHDTLDPAVDDELRARLRALGRQAADAADTEAALQATSEPPRSPVTRMLGVAACLLVAVALVATLRREVGGTDPAATPPEDCLETTAETLPTDTPGGPMDTRLATRVVAGAAAAIALLGACDDGPRTLAEGDVELVGDTDLGGQHLVVSAEEEDGVVSGEVRLNDSGVDDEEQLTIITLECARTDLDDLVVLGGTVTGPEGNTYLDERFALAIRDGDPSSVALAADDDGATTCDEFLEGLTEQRLLEVDGFFDVESGDLEIG